MDEENRLLPRLQALLDTGEEIVSTLRSPGHGLYAATNRRVVSIRGGAVGYTLRVHAYQKITRVWHQREDDRWVVQLYSHGRSLALPVSSEHEAESFVHAVAQQLLRRDLV